MTPAMRDVLHFFLNYGVFGLLLLTIADDSFLFLPVGGDLLMVILVARHHANLPIYIAAGAAGSTIGVLFLDLVCRKGGEAGLKRIVKPRLHNYLKGKIEKHAAVAVFIACIAPPPFPFGAVIGVASALQYPRARLLTVVFSARVARFLLVGWAAIKFGHGILRIANSPGFLWFMGCFIALCLIGSIIEVTHWVRTGNTGARFV
jgi:membrane protein YqaA with SNARE-associated domain